MSSVCTGHPSLRLHQPATTTIATRVQVSTAAQLVTLVPDRVGVPPTSLYWEGAVPIPTWVEPILVGVELVVVYKIMTSPI